MKYKRRKNVCSRLKGNHLHDFDLGDTGDSECDALRCFDHLAHRVESHHLEGELLNVCDEPPGPCPSTNDCSLLCGSAASSWNGKNTWEIGKFSGWNLQALTFEQCWRNPFFYESIQINPIFEWVTLWILQTQHTSSDGQRASSHAELDWEKAASSLRLLQRSKKCWKKPAVQSMSELDLEDSSHCSHVREQIGALSWTAFTPTLRYAKRKEWKESK